MDKDKTCATCKWWELLDGSGVPYQGVCLCSRSAFDGRLQIETDTCGEHTPKEQPDAN